MRGNREYHTRQKRLILACLREKQDEHVNVENILGYLRENGETVGQTTVYRYLDKLVQNGVILKYIGLDANSASYQYVGEPAAHKDHYHLVCLQCGRLVHLNCKYIDEFAAHIQNDHSFSLDCMKTVFYGYCADCTKCCRSESEQRHACACHKKRME